MMKLSILYHDGTEEDLTVKRVSNISSKTSTPLLYFEKMGDMEGKGTTLRMEKISCWEVKPAYDMIKPVWSR